MPDPSYVAATIGIAATITVALRAAPFSLAHLKNSKTLRHLGRHLPSGLMVILVIYLLQDTPVDPLIAALPTVAGVAITAVVHLWRRQALTSIVAGTLAFATALALTT